MVERLTELHEIQAATWRELQRACHDRHHAWRTPVYASVGEQGPDARTVVLREANDQVDPPARQLVIYTDARAAKVAQLRHDARAMLVFWSKTLSWQLRCQVTATVHEDGLAATSRWVRVKQSPAADDYLSALPPGAELAGPPAARVAHAAAGPAATPAHFAVIEAEIVSTDWLELHPQGHRRARWDAAGARWLQA
jgi:pyridoxamine 5'-phosphate oxidase